VLEGGNLLVVGAVDDAARADALRARGAEVLVLRDPAGKVPLAALAAELARRELNEIHVEAGFRLNGSLLAAGLVDELLVYLAPSVLGDSSRGMFNLRAAASLDERVRLRFMETCMIGPDLRLRATVAN
jgi:diaminohydroxyphosphoribosylaminopyrimidine deaminase/5-amino-6-(5-phosphoribosylamino)uracil reductase